MKVTDERFSEELIELFSDPAYRAFRNYDVDSKECDFIVSALEELQSYRKGVKQAVEEMKRHRKKFAGRNNEELAIACTTIDGCMQTLEMHLP